MPNTRQILMAVLALLLVAGAAVPAAAEPTPSSDLLLPYFEVHLSSQKTTLFALGNAAGEPVDVKASLHTNWGIPVVERTIRLQAGEVKTVNLRDWLVAGNVPDPVLRGVHLEHVQAALAGQLSPKDDLFYATQADPFDPELLVGYVTFRVQGNPRLDALWGDYFWVDPEQDYAEGELLVDIDLTSDCGALCKTHRMRFMDGGGFDGGTKLVVWSHRRVQPAPNANAAFARLLALSPFHEEPGAEFDERVLELLPVQLVDVRELFLDQDFGWLDIKTDEEIYVGVRYSASNRYSVTLQSWCIPPPPKPPVPPGEPGEPALTIEKSTNGEDADFPPGPVVKDAVAGAVPGDVTWEYVVTNTGEVALSQIEVSDDQEGAIACPKTFLAPGESMTCTKAGVAPLQAGTPFFYDNLGTVVGRTPDGDEVTDDDPSHYQVPPAIVEPPEPQVDIEKATNGKDADTGKGPKLTVGQTVTWTYVVTNTGEETLQNVQVADDREGTVACPKSTLAVNESMTCTKTGTAVAAQYANVGTVAAVGSESGGSTSDSDPSHYHADPPPPPPASIDIEKATNGFDADSAPGPELEIGQAVTWTYVVTNTGQAKLNGVAVTDDREGSITCPKATLQPGESMTCTEHGTAVEGQYANLGSVTGTPQGGGSPVSDSDPSHYHADPPPPPPASIDIEKATNGHDADTGKGPKLGVGQAVTWTYVVTNTGQAKLTNVAVADDKEGAISCPKSTLQPGESMTCVETGTAVVGQYANLGTVVGKRFGDGLQVSDSDPSHYHADPPPECGACEGKVTRLTLRYLGGIAGAHVQVIAKSGPGSPTVFDGIVSPGGTFEVVGPASGNGGFAGTLGTEIRIKVNGIDNAAMHTSCSQPIGPGLVSGDFEVLEGASSGGGLLCPLN